MRTARHLPAKAVDRDRFWGLVDKSPGPDSCWRWTGPRNVRGYGVFRVRGRVGAQLAHRIAYALSHAHGAPAGKGICHRCDYKLCCNPAHLYPGTQRDNVRDAIANGLWNPARGDRSGARLHPDRVPRGERHGSFLHPERRPWGERHGRAKLKADDVRAIRRRGLSERYSDLAAEFGVTVFQISGIVRRISWAKLPD